jgi:hypothetical protein
MVVADLEVHMKKNGIIFAIVAVALICALPAGAVPKPQAPQITGQYVESRTADIYTGPCIANSETNIAGKQAVMVWHVDQGTWTNVDLSGLTVVAVVNAADTLGMQGSDPLLARSILIVDQSATNAQRAALINFAQAQGGAILSRVMSVEVAPMKFETNVGGRHGASLVTAGNLVRVTTRALNNTDEFCHNEDVYYPPLAANLTHSMPAVATESGYHGNGLGMTWTENERRGVFVGTFAY